METTATYEVGGDNKHRQEGGKGDDYVHIHFAADSAHQRHEEEVEHVGKLHQVYKRHQ